MKHRIILLVILIGSILGISACKRENTELKRDAKEIADAMCKSMGVMNKLKTADPADSILVQNLQGEYKIIEAEMAVLYQDFRAKYGEKVATKEVSDDFRRYLSEAMLECKNLSKEDREAFEKETQ
jgi:hypothetical protein